MIVLDKVYKSYGASPVLRDCTTAIEGQTFRTFEVYIVISLLYLLLVSIVTYGLLLVPGARESATQSSSNA